MERIAILIAASLALSGCVLAPNTLSPVVEHVSHATQHRPFTNSPTSYGYNQVALVAHWRIVRGAFVEVSEGYNWGPRNTEGEACGGLYGPHEVFMARAGYTFTVKP